MRGLPGRFRPRVVVVEMKQTNLARAAIEEQAIHELLDECGYRSTGQVFHRNEVSGPHRSERRRGEWTQTTATSAGRVVASSVDPLLAADRAV